MKSSKQHVSIRVSWHDTGGGGWVCGNPRLNGSCLRLKRIGEERDATAEDLSNFRGHVTYFADSITSFQQEQRRTFWPLSSTTCLVSRAAVLPSWPGPGRKRHTLKVRVRAQA